MATKMCIHFLRVCLTKRHHFLWLLHHAQARKLDQRHSHRGCGGTSPQIISLSAKLPNANGARQKKSSLGATWARTKSICRQIGVLHPTYTFNSLRPRAGKGGKRYKEGRRQVGTAQFFKIVRFSEMLMLRWNIFGLLLIVKTKSLWENR